MILTLMLALSMSIPAHAAETEASVSDIEYFSSDSVIGNKIMNVANQLREESNKGLSEEELNELANELLGVNANSGNLRTAYDLDGYITNQLNSQERTLYDNHRAKALLCISNGVLATNYANDAYAKENLHNGNGDAFRHTIWNFGMVIDVGYDFAKQWSDAHEYGTSGNPEIERTMDLYNNGVGLKLGKDNPNTALHSAFKKKTTEKVDGGYCRTIKNGKLAWSDSSGKK